MVSASHRQLWLVKVYRIVPRATHLLNVLICYYELPRMASLWPSDPPSMVSVDYGVHARIQRIKLMDYDSIGRVVGGTCVSQIHYLQITNKSLANKQNLEAYL